MAKLITLATKLIKKTDNDKALDVLKEAVEDNEMAFRNDLHLAKKTAKAAAKRVVALASDATASSKAVIEADRAVIIADKNVEAIEAAITARF